MTFVMQAMAAVFHAAQGIRESLQYSVFRCRLTKRQLERMRWELEKELASEDSLMIVGLCNSCTSKLWPVTPRSSG